jgi:capsule polysaccharide modification protein KpsS
MLRDLVGKRVLLLQGPNGPFFKRFAADLRARGCQITKVNFNAGDGLFYRGPEVVRFTGHLSEWPAFVRALLVERRIERVFLFGDQKPIHRAATAVCKELGVDFWALEEGYLRPDYVTIEKGGVNGNSSLPRDPEFYRRATAGLPDLPPPRPLGNTFYHHMWWAILNAVACTLCFWRYPRYRHHRQINAFLQAYQWGRGAFRKVWYRFKERHITARLVGEYRHRFFLLPLQVYCDAQLQHSSYPSMEAFVEDVVAQFARHAPRDMLLVVKHHPHDRAYRDYTRYLKKLAAQHGLTERMIYCHDLHLPTLLKAARGVVTMNSTVGTSALFHHTPVKVMGRAIYDIPGLTSQVPLERFFHEPGAVDHELLTAFARWLREDNQINGSFYKRNPVLGTACGLDAAVFAPTEAAATPEPTPARSEPVRPPSSAA